MECSVTILLACILITIPAALSCNVFILAGQSNMAGRGGIVKANKTSWWDGQVPPECHADPRILRLNDDLLWEEAQEPLHQNISFSECYNNSQPSGIGPGMPFSNSILESDPTIGIVGLVPCAVGGTSITQWSRGGCLYSRMLTRVQAALAEGGVLRAMLWYQGETDAENIDDANMYKSRLEKFFEDVRNDLMSPSLPIIQVDLKSAIFTHHELSKAAEAFGVALASGGTPPIREIVRKAQLNTQLPNVKCVDAQGLALNGDNVHLTTSAQVQLGSMLADAFLRYFN